MAVDNNRKIRAPDHGVTPKIAKAMAQMITELATQDQITINQRQWLFRRRRQFALGIYFVVIIHVCLYSQICYYCTSDSVV